MNVLVASPTAVSVPLAPSQRGIGGAVIDGLVGMTLTVTIEGSLTVDVPQ